MLISLGAWLGGMVLAGIALARGENRRIALPALALNALPLIGALVISLLIAAR
ncbi:hypothetical protein ACFOLC_08680 [Lysobacter cavernae]|uniref:Uncharacterized protein n=1 Tax=Lysobacter cavernae TaxID=1685901 RepID=A0ABV7RQI6_9GAMM